MNEKVRMAKIEDLIAWSVESEGKGDEKVTVERQIWELIRVKRDESNTIPCLWPAPLSTVWHWAHLVLKIFSPFLEFPGGASSKDAMDLCYRSFEKQNAKWNANETKWSWNEIIAPRHHTTPQGGHIKSF